MKRTSLFTEAYTHFTVADPYMAGLLKDASTSNEPLLFPTPIHPHEYFRSITQSIVSQQISVRAASTIFERLKILADPISPERIAHLSIEDLRTCGLSGQKASYIHTNALIWDTVPIHTFNAMSDADVILELTKLRGIGTWTAEMFLMFSLARPDVFSYGDLALMQGLRSHYKYQKHWKRKITKKVESWSPYRTIAALVLWHHKDVIPFTKKT